MAQRQNALVRPAEIDKHAVAMHMDDFSSNLRLRLELFGGGRRFRFAFDQLVDRHAAQRRFEFFGQVRRQFGAQFGIATFSPCGMARSSLRTDLPGVSCIGFGARSGGCTSGYQRRRAVPMTALPRWTFGSLCVDRRSLCWSAAAPAEAARRAVELRPCGRLRTCSGPACGTRLRRAAESAARRRLHAACRF